MVYIHTDERAREWKLRENPGLKVNNRTYLNTMVCVDDHVITVMNASSTGRCYTVITNMFELRHGNVCAEDKTLAFLKKHPL